MKRQAALSASMIAMSLVLTVAGCGKSRPIDFDRVTRGQLPVDLSDWAAKERIGDQPSLLDLTRADGHDLLIRGGKCPSTGYQLKVTGAEGTGVPHLALSASIGRPWWKRADTTTSYPEDYVRLKWPWGPMPELFVLKLGDAELNMRLQKPSDGQPEAIRVYTTDTPFTCGPS